MENIIARGYLWLRDMRGWIMCGMITSLKEPALERGGIKIREHTCIWSVRVIANALCGVGNVGHSD